MNTTLKINSRNQPTTQVEPKRRLFDLHVEAKMKIILTTFMVFFMFLQQTHAQSLDSITLAAEAEHKESKKNWKDKPAREKEEKKRLYFSTLKAKLKVLKAQLDFQRIAFIGEMQARITNPLNSLSYTEDTFNGTTWYTSSLSPDEGFFVYIANPPKQPLHLRVRIQYEAKVWLFLRSYTIKTGNVFYKFRLKREEVDRNVTNSGIREVLDHKIRKKEYKVIRAILNAPETTIRLYGSNGVQDILLTEKDKNALREVVLSYRLNMCLSGQAKVLGKSCKQFNKNIKKLVKAINTYVASEFNLKPKAWKKIEEIAKQADIKFEFDEDYIGNEKTFEKITTILNGKE